MKREKIDFLKTWPFLMLLACCACRDTGKNGKPLSTPTSGEIDIVADESLKPIVDAEIDAFEALYQNAEINVEYVSEAAALQKFMADSAVLAVLARTLTEKEVSAIEAEKIFPSKVQIGIGAIVLITHKKNPDSLVSMEDLHKVFNGEIDQWGKIGPQNGQGGQIQIVFANKNASSVRFIKDSIANGSLPENAFALDSNEKVIEYVSKNENALGIIGLSWISDNDASRVMGFLDKIRVVGISGAKGDEYHKPYQAYIAQGLYPLDRNIYIVSREARSGLGSGFMSFVASAKGQRVILKSGLVPATMPVRILQFPQN